MYKIIKKLVKPKALNFPYKWKFLKYFGIICA